MRETLEASWGTSDGRVSIWYRKAPGKGTPINAQRWFNYPAQLDSIINFVESIKDKDVYFSPPIYDEDSRTPDHAIWVSTIWCDADLCHPENFRLPPSRILKTSVGNGDRWQCFWDLDSPVTAAQASAIAHKIAIAHQDQGADQSSWPANKLMRIPGTANTNWGDWTVEEILGTGEVYSELDLLDAYEDIELPSGERVPTKRMVEKIAEAEVISPEGLPDYQSTLDLIPSTEHRLYDLIFKEPPGGPEGWRSEQLWALLLDLYRFGMTTEQVLTIAWHAPTASKVRDDPRGLSWLQQQAAKAGLFVQDEKGQTSEPVVEHKAEKLPPVHILSTKERKLFEARTTWDVYYQEWARTKIYPFNTPYHDAMVWTILSLAFGEAGHIPSKKGKRYLNVYVMPIGPSSSGKTEAKTLGWSLIRKLFPGESPDIGGGHSKNALIEQLLSRDGKVSLIHADEAHGKFKEMKSASWTNGIQELWADIYEGWIPSLGRVGKTELMKDDATGVVTMHMQGTLTGMLDILDRDMFMSGYLARQIWFIGEDIPVTDASLQETQAEDDDEVSYEGLPKYWAGVFLETRQRLRQGLPEGETSRPMRFTTEALDRHTEMKIKVTRHYEKMADQEIYRPAIRRFSDNVRKAATLLAMADGQTAVSLPYWIAAAGHAERWLVALDQVANGITDNYFSKQLEDIEKFISSKPVECSVAELYKHRKEPKRMTDEYLSNLLVQKRIIELPRVAGGPLYYRSTDPAKQKGKS